MTLRYHPTPIRWLALLPVIAWPLVSTAQTQTLPAPPAFKSAFEGYQADTDDKTGNWKEANDTTARIGGWRAYAKEAADAEPVKPAPPTMMPAPSPQTRLAPAAVKP